MNRNELRETLRWIYIEACEDKNLSENQMVALHAATQLMTLVTDSDLELATTWAKQQVAKDTAEQEEQ